ncbi:MAG: phage shock protein PspA [Gammaproteobacteria bacterium]|nr:phage shock protein PspA [Gammaproteobacteria bacterium]
MSIFSRLSDIISANLNAMLDKAEDPEKVIRLIIQEMEDTLVELRTSAARTIADKKEHERKIARLHDDLADWNDKAELAVHKGRDDLARSALTQKARLADEIEHLGKDVGHIQETVQKYSDDIAGLQAKLDDAKARQQVLLRRRMTASSQIRVRKQIHDGRIDKAMARFDYFEQKLDEKEGEVESYDLGRQKSLADEIDALANDERAEQELSELKKRLQSSSGE